jgi:CO/xanthine dehydrogenase Mo-binding subunit
VHAYVRSQGLMFAEMWTEQIARVVGRPDHEIRELNMYKEGDVTHFGQVRRGEGAGKVRGSCREGARQMTRHVSMM